MLRSATVSTILACSVVGLACSNDPTSSPSPADPAPALRTAQSPDGPGAYVLRSGPIFAFAFVPSDLSITVIEGVSADQLPLLCSGGEITYEGGNYQLVLGPTGAGQEFFRPGKHTVAVFAGFFDLCSAPVAMGEGSYTFASISTTGAAGFTQVFRARVTDQSGEPHHILARFRVQLNHAGEEQVFMEDFDYR